MGDKKEKTAGEYPAHKIIYPERPLGRKTLWIAALAGAVLAGWGIVYYGQSLRDQGRAQARSEIEQERLAASTIVSGIVKEARRQRLILSVIAEDEREQDVEVNTPFGTKFYQLTPDPAAPRVEIGSFEIEPGSFVTVRTKKPVRSETTINAVEVLKVN